MFTINKKIVIEFINSIITAAIGYSVRLAGLNSTALHVKTIFICG